MNKGIHLDLDTWIVPGQILMANLRRVLITIIIGQQLYIIIIIIVWETVTNQPVPRC